MRLALAALLLAGCIIRPEPEDDYYEPPPSGGSWGSGWGGSGGTTDYGCKADSECPSDYVCARTRECLPASTVRIVHVNWTVGGEPTSETTCANAPKLDITFYNNGSDMFGFSPVPCSAGRFTVDKMPTRYTYVQLARAGDYGGGMTAMFDATGTATIDLPY